MKTLKSFCVTVLLLCLVVLGSASPASAQTVPFKVYITELWQLDANVDPILGMIGDYYARVTINGVAQSNNGACEDGVFGGLVVPLRLFKNFEAIEQCKAKTPWAFTQQVPAGAPVHVRIQIFDADEFFDDEADAKPGEGNAIDLDIDPASGLWSGDFAWPQNCSRPDLAAGGNRVNVCWQAGFDTDEDGLLDVWEKLGVDTDNDGGIDLNLPALGANPLRKDVFVELDHLVASTHTHGPKQFAFERFMPAFANAPVANPDGTTGVQLHVDVGPLYGAGAVFSFSGAGGVTATYGDLGGGNAIPEDGNEIIDAFGGLGPATTFQDLKEANFASARELVFRYAIFGHQTNATRATHDCTGGVASANRRDFMVTLGGVDAGGSSCWGGFTIGPNAVGSDEEQAGVFMHELGHSLGLLHGGADNVNRKPNYLSVMSYSYLDCGLPESKGILPGGCDYSRSVNGEIPPPLNENDLDECVGIAGGLGFGEVDWNQDDHLEGVSGCGVDSANVRADANRDGICVKPGPNERPDSVTGGDDDLIAGAITDGPNRLCQSTAKAGTDDIQIADPGTVPSQPLVLHSHDDWSHIDPSIFSAPLVVSAASDQPEPTAQVIKEAHRVLSDMMAPRISLEQTGPATAQPGDVVTYATTIANTGRGPAVSSTLQATNPDGTVETTDLGTIVVGTGPTLLSKFIVPASACPGTFTGAAAALAFKDFGAQDLRVAVTTPLEILDVAAPAFDLSVSPTGLFPPNHDFVEVTATITATDNCDRNPAVTLVSITTSDPSNNKEPDVSGAEFGTDDRTFLLRAERDTGHGSTGRVYTVTYRVTDRSGNASVQSAVVTVPANNGVR